MGEVTVKPGRRKFLSDEIRHILELHDAGWSYSQIARHLDRPRKSVHGVIEREEDKKREAEIRGELYHRDIKPPTEIFWKPPLSRLMGRK